MKPILLAVLAAAVAVVATPRPAAAQAALTAPEIVEGVQQFYAGVTAMRAKFRHEVTPAASGKTTISDGTVVITRPGQSRWRYFPQRSQGRSQSFQHAVIYRTTPLGPLAIASSFASGSIDLATDVTARIDASGTDHEPTDRVIELAPVAPSPSYRTLTLVVDAATFRVRQAIVVDPAGDKHHVHFYTPELSPP